MAALRRALVVPYVTPPSILSGALNRFVWFIYFIRRTGSKQTDLYCVSEIYDFKSLVDIVIVVWYIGRTILSYALQYFCISVAAIATHCLVCCVVAVVEACKGASDVINVRSCIFPLVGLIC